MSDTCGATGAALRPRSSAMSMTWRSSGFVRSLNYACHTTDHAASSPAPSIRASHDPSSQTRAQAHILTALPAPRSAQIQKLSPQWPGAQETALLTLWSNCCSPDRNIRTAWSAHVRKSEQRYHTEELVLPYEGLAANNSRRSAIRTAGPVTTTVKQLHTEYRRKKKSNIIRQRGT